MTGFGPEPRETKVLAGGGGLVGCGGAAWASAAKVFGWGACMVNPPSCVVTLPPVRVPVVGIGMWAPVGSCWVEIWGSDAIGLEGCTRNIEDREDTMLGNLNSSTGAAGCTIF